MEKTFNLEEKIKQFRKDLIVIDDKILLEFEKSLNKHQLRILAKFVISNFVDSVHFETFMKILEKYYEFIKNKEEKL